MVNELDKEINEDLLNEMAIDEMLTKNFGQLSLNALAGTEANNSIKLQATVSNKTMLILVDTSSSHNFVSSHLSTSLNYQLYPWGNRRSNWLMVTA